LRQWGTGYQDWWKIRRGRGFGRERGRGRMTRRESGREIGPF